jgi:hypothetical protein
MLNYNVVGCEVINTTKVPDGALGTKIDGIVCKPIFVEIKANSTNKQSEGTSERTRKSIDFVAYKGILSLLQHDSMVKIDGFTYGNLEVQPIVGSKMKVKVTGYV